MTEERVRANIGRYDFIDIGSNHGDSFLFGIEALGGTAGLALDINPRAVAKLLEKGIPALVEDCRTFNFVRSNFRFAVLSHILEHMDSTRQVVELLLGTARNVSEFLYIRQPFFDETAYLSTLGLKIVGSNLSYHPLHKSSQDYLSLLLGAGFRDFAIYGDGAVAHSHEWAKIVSGAARLNTKGWKREPETKPARVEFERPIYRELVIFIQLCSGDYSPQLTAAAPHRKLLFKSSREFSPLPD